MYRSRVYIPRRRRRCRRHCRGWRRKRGGTQVLCDSPLWPGAVRPPARFSHTRCSTLEKMYWDIFRKINTETVSRQVIIYNTHKRLDHLINAINKSTDGIKK